MRVLCLVLVTICAAGCGPSREDSAARERHTPAYELGRAAKEITKESGRAAKAVGHELKNGAGEAREGWKDQAQRDSERQKKNNP